MQPTYHIPTYQTPIWKLLKRNILLLFIAGLPTGAIVYSSIPIYQAFGLDSLINILSQSIYPIAIIPCIALVLIVSVLIGIDCYYFVFSRSLLNRGYRWGLAGVIILSVYVLGVWFFIMPLAS